MDELKVTSTSNGIITLYTVPPEEKKSTVMQTVEYDKKMIPRKQNKVVAERTSDMFMSGLMCE